MADFCPSWCNCSTGLVLALSSSQSRSEQHLELGLDQTNSRAYVKVAVGHQIYNLCVYLEVKRGDAMENPTPMKKEKKQTPVCYFQFCTAFHVLALMALS